MAELPESVTLEFLHSSGDQVRLIDLGTEFLDENGISSSRYSSPFKIAIMRKQSKAGNSFYEYSQNGVPLPDGLSTYLKVEGTVVPMGKTRPSKNGYPTREGQAQLLIGGTMYKVTAYLTEAKLPYYVKVVMHKKPDTSGNLAKAHKAPKGGSIL